MGKNSVTQIAFGQTVEDEYKDNLRHVSKVIDDVFILFSLISLTYSSCWREMLVCSSLTEVIKKF